MKRFFYATIIGIFLTCGAADWASAQPEDPAKDEVPSEKDSPAVQKARSEIRAARAALDQALESNARVPGSLSSDMIEERRVALELAELRLKNIQNPDPKFEAELNLRYLRAMSKLKDNRYRRAQEANARAAGAVADPELEQLKLDAEAAKLAVERAKLEAAKPAADNGDSSTIGQLRSEVAELRKEVEALRKAVSALQKANE